MSADKALTILAEYVETAQGTILNALQTQNARMVEAADYARNQGQIGYVEVFHEQAIRTAEVRQKLNELLTALAEERQDDFADQG